MSPVRPLFRDGAILGASDLSALETLDRDRDARHARHLHTPGVAAGLELHKEPRESTQGTYFEVTLQPGYALDGTGRELVVSAPLPVSIDRFNADNPQPEADEADEDRSRPYPVFIRGVDAAPTTANGAGCQGASGSSRIEETVEIEFGRPGDADADQPVPAPDAGAGDGAWRVLVGFVRVSLTMNPHRFLDAVAVADGVRVPDAGVRAGLVAGRSGALEVRSRPAGDAGVPAIVLDDAAGSVVIGVHTGTGPVKPLLTVDSAGNVVAEGTIKGVLASGAVLVSSGAAFDGMVLPLPAGVRPESVASGAVELAIQLTPRYPNLALAPTPGDRFHPAECRVDEERRVHCWGTWSGATTPPVDRSAACDYLVLATVPDGGA